MVNGHMPIAELVQAVVAGQHISVDLGAGAHTILNE
jgi:hypothetical protein